MSDSPCPECGSTRGCPASDDPINPLPRWEDDKVRKNLGFPTEGRCPNCGDALGRGES